MFALPNATGPGGIPIGLKQFRSIVTLFVMNEVTSFLAAIDVDPKACALQTREKIISGFERLEED